MPSSGNKPKPIAVQIAEGDPRKIGKRKLAAKRELEPKATRGLPTCPRHLRGRARAAWNFWREELHVMNLDSLPDAMMLEGACVAYKRAVEADIMLSAGFTVEEPILDKEGEIVGTKIKNHPAVAVSNAAWKQLKSFCSEFGLSPVSRTRLALQKPDGGEKDLMAMLSAPRASRVITQVEARKNLGLEKVQ